jgi:thiol:disulfide interchange protein
MELPYLLLALAPGAAGWLPRPGAWMDTMRGVMGFLLAGALIWLLYVLGNQIAPERLALVEGALLGAGLLVWLAHRRPYGSAGRRTGAVAALLAGVGAVALAVQSPPAGPRAAELAEGGGAERIAWRPWDPAEAERLAAAGTPVFLDVTADWCVTCKVNERLILETDAVRAAFARHGVVAMKADWTSRDDRIGAFLAEHGRYGIPFYLLYRPGAEPLVFPELLTRDLVVRGLDELGEPASPASPASPAAPGSPAPAAAALSPPPPARGPRG